MYKLASMSVGYIIKNALIFNEGKRFRGSLKTKGELIEKIYEGEIPKEEESPNYTIIDGNGKWLFPGFIDDQVHFREPGLTHKGDLYTEPKAAVAGGITSYMEMPNTSPAATTQALLSDKYLIASEKSLANYSFYIGGNNTNIDQLLKTDPKTVCGVKLFLGSSTGNLLVDSCESVNTIFREVKMIIALHCEDDPSIAANKARIQAKYGANIPVEMHPVIRDAEACYRSSSKAVELAEKYGTRIHVLHISTARETELFRNDIPLRDKKITSEACVHHLWFSDADYTQLGAAIKWNPAIKSEADREAIREAVRNGRIDVLATDHAPHTLLEKKNPYDSCPSGGPLVQHALQALLEMCFNGIFTPELVVEKYAHRVADLFQIDRRGYLREGYYADLVLINPARNYPVTEDSLLYKCAWSPFTGLTFRSSVEKTFVNGHMVYNEGVFDESKMGMRLLFNR
jgi:dihydroorotase